MTRNNQVLVPAFVITGLLLASPALAADGTMADPKGLIAIAASLAIGLAALGGTLGQGNAASSTFESIARNPQAADKINTPFFVGMALIESLVLLGFVIAFLLQGYVA